MLPTALPTSCSRRPAGLAPMVLIGAGTVIAAMALPQGPAGAAPRLTACPTRGSETARVAQVDENLDLVLTDGRSLHLAGLDPPQPTQATPDLAARARAALTRLVAGGISFMLLAPKPDRWGRIPAVAFAAGADAAAPSNRNIAEAVLAQGFARYMPNPEAHSCRAAFLTAEAAGRDAKLGLWNDPFYAMIDATNGAAFAGKGATNVIVEGRLQAVSSTGFRTTLEFAIPRRRALSVTILQRNVAIFDRSGLDFSALIGRTLRVRGLLDLRFGPQVEIASADDVELIANKQEQGARAQQSDAAVPPARDP